jgi:phospholipase/carboxylesterase
VRPWCCYGPLIGLKGYRLPHPKTKVSSDPVKVPKLKSREQTPGGSVERGRPQMRRRDFVKGSLTALATPLLLGCDVFTSGPETSTPDPQDPRLSARPGTPSATPTLGLSDLGLGDARDGILYVPQTYSVDTPAPLFVALHGAGGAGENWASYPDRAEARGMVFLAPDSRGDTWDAIRGRFGPDVEFIDRALQHVFDRCAIDPRRIALAGFSDGASYALSLGVANGDLFSHLIAYSPGFVRSVESLVGKPRVYVSHGVSDTVLPVTLSRDRIVPAFTNEGYDVTYEEFDGGHEVPAEISESALDWFLGNAATG